ncbi:MAG: ribulose phosphate epimerase [delta proteobacterium ML8_D]|nr:MAG: ribulose phosphate epimerase [delta proteobacterium ML8_D]
MKIQIAPSILSADFGRLAEEVRSVEMAGADVIHIDVMDGHFVPNITIGPMVAKALRSVTNLPLDVHLMIEFPDRYIEAFAQAGASWITVHVEASTHIHRTINSIKALGVKAGAVLNPATSPSTLEYLLADLDLVLVMSVNPGFGGQHFIPSSLDKIRHLRKILAVLDHHVPIEVDGGVNFQTIEAVASAGADICVAGSAIFGSHDYAATIKKLKELGQKGISERGSSFL